MVPDEPAGCYVEIIKRDKECRGKLLATKLFLKPPKCHVDWVGVIWV